MALVTGRDEQPPISTRKMSANDSAADCASDAVVGRPVYFKRGRFDNSGRSPLKGRRERRGLVRRVVWWVLEASCLEICFVEDEVEGLRLEGGVAMNGSLGSISGGESGSDGSTGGNVNSGGGV